MLSKIVALALVAAASAFAPTGNHFALLHLGRLFSCLSLSMRGGAHCGSSLLATHAHVLRRHEAVDLAATKTQHCEKVSRMEDCDAFRQNTLNLSLKDRVISWSVSWMPLRPRMSQKWKAAVLSVYQ